MITVTAPGKIHLMGEHAVVYGYPGLLAAVNRRVRVSVAEASGKTHQIFSSESPEYVLHILSCIEDEYKMSLPALSITIHSEFPAGYHVGSSAAIAVACVGAVVYFVKKLWNPAAINKLAYEAERFVHGTPSGGDNTASTFGGIVWFRKELEFLKSIWQLPFRPHPNISHFYLANTGKPIETTKDMVARVAGRMQKEAPLMHTAMRINELQTRRIASALKSGDEPELMAGISEGQETLNQMGVVSPLAANFIQSVQKAGGAAKILGGGGVTGSVGFILCYHSDAQKLANVSKEAGYALEQIILGEEGVRLEK